MWSQGTMSRSPTERGTFNEHSPILKKHWDLCMLGTQVSYAKMAESQFGGRFMWAQEP